MKSAKHPCKKSHRVRMATPSGYRGGSRVTWNFFHTFPYLLFCCLGIATGALAIEFPHPVDGASMQCAILVAAIGQFPSI